MPQDASGSARSGAARSHARLAGIVVAALLLALTLCGAWKRGAFLPAWAVWEGAERAADLDGDGAFEAWCVRDRRLFVFEDAAVAASTPKGWFVQCAKAADVDADGSPELVMLVWKRGSFGNARPFWVAHNDLGFSQHVFIMGYRGGRLVQKWLSSDVGVEVARLSADALGRVRLFLADGSERLLEWQGWGLTYLDDATPSMRAAHDEAATLVAAGDVIPHAGIVRQVAQGCASALFEGVAPLLADADLAAVNLEAPVADATAAAGPLSFAAPAALGDALVDAGFNVLTLANNHALDAGEKGLASTLAFWRDLHPGVAAIGAAEAGGDPYAARIVHAGTISVALFDATALVNGGASATGALATLADDPDQLAARIASTEADARVVFLHAGQEYAEEPEADLRVLVRALVDAGADAVICTHPHVVQTAGRVRGESGREGLVCYSLGNLVHNQPYPQAALGAVARLTFAKETRTGATRVAGCELAATVCDSADGTTRALPLEAYGAREARSHHLNGADATAVTPEGLHDQWVRAFASDAG